MFMGVGRMIIVVVRNGRCFFGGKVVWRVRFFFVRIGVLRVIIRSVVLDWVRSKRGIVVVINKWFIVIFMNNLV